MPELIRQLGSPQMPELIRHPALTPISLPQAEATSHRAGLFTAAVQQVIQDMVTKPLVSQETKMMHRLSCLRSWAFSSLLLG